MTHFGSDIPEQIAGFRLEEEIARGGMGSVFRARQVSIDRVVALKVLASKYTDDRVFRSRFLKEARAAARLNHPNIVQAIDVGEAAGRFYFAMEFVDGRSLAAMVKERGRLPHEEACAIILQVARALEHAGRFGMVHLDVKPGNILVTATGQAKLADFGLARHVQDRDAIYSEKRVVFGTPHYMAPEQLRGGAHADARCDIYALGVTFHELVVGRNPFSAPTHKEILNNVRAAQVPRADQVESSVPEDVALVIAKMMHPDPRQRYWDAKELLVDLEALSRLRPPPVVRNLPIVAERAPSPEVSRRLLVGIVLGSAAVLLVTVVVLMMEYNRASRTTEVVEPTPLPESESPPVRRSLYSVVEEAERRMGREDFQGALQLYQEFGLAYPGTASAEEVERAALGVRQRARWRAEALEKEAEQALEGEDFAAAAEIADRIGQFGLSQTDPIARRLREKVRRERDAARRREEQARREAVAQALQGFQSELAQLLADERFPEAVRLCESFLAEPSYASVRAAPETEIERLRALERIQAAIRSGAQDADKSVLLPLRDLSADEMRTFAGKGVQNAVLRHAGLAALFELQGRGEDALAEVAALRELRTQLPKWIAEAERRALLASATAALDAGDAEKGVEHLRVLKGRHRQSLFVKQHEDRIAALVARARDLLTAGMVSIPAGMFVCQKDLRVTLSDYYIERREVTNAEYAVFLEALRKAPDPAAWDHPLQPHWKRDHLPLDWEKLKGRGNHPVVGVDWFDACAYATWRGRRLPTDREWEKAARGTDGRRYPWGERWKDGLCNAPPAVAATSADLPTGVKPVGSFPQGDSPYGLTDVAGNAREWVYDEVASATDTVYARGGSWSDPAMACATTYRLPISRMTRDLATGFRCAADPVSLEP